ncbi:MAG: site-specific DNA-methyltransferase [Kiritimatiellae bacterium]|nr:site-specific DNA-methyltransferase [Kiritimatiellia bacterium]
MKMSFNENLIELLKTDSRFVDDEGELVRAAVIDRAWKIDHDLVRLLLGKPEIKDKFFDEIECHWIFNINTFIEYVSAKNFLANSYTRFRNKIGLNIDGKFLRERGEVSLVWPYKDCVLEGGQTQEEEKRKEIFFNEILAQDEIDRLFDPKVLANWKRYTVDGEQKVTEFKRDESGTIRENLIVKGNNLLALHTLKKQFRGKVKLIYIDPPYNTGTDSFGYNDNFNHSTWLTFMKNRLEVSRELLRNDGSIWINIDDDEAHYLKVLCDDIFGRENFVRNVLWQKRTSPDMRAVIGDGHDHILVFAKNKEIFKTVANKLPKTEKQREAFKNPDNDPNGPWVSSDFTAQGYRPNQMYQIATPGGKKYYPPEGRCWKNIESVYLELAKNGRMWFGQDGCGVPRRKTYLNEVESNTVWSWWPNNEVGHNQEAKKESIALFGVADSFLTPKPERLLQRIIQIATNEDEGDIVLDFFAGSATTAAVAHKMNRQWITVEQMDYVETITAERLKKVIGTNVKKDEKMFDELEFDAGGISKAVNWQGGGDFVYCELMKYNEAFMDKIQGAKSTQELVNLWKDVAENSFLNWYVNSEKPEEAVNDFMAIGETENGLNKQKKLLAELLNKNQLYVNLSEINDADFNVSDEDKKLNQAFYGENA